MFIDEHIENALELPRNEVLLGGFQKLCALDLSHGRLFGSDQDTALASLTYKVLNGLGDDITAVRLIRERLKLQVLKRHK